MTGQIALPGLVASNPLGYFAALGLVRTLARAEEAVTLRFSDAVVPHAVIEPIDSIDAIVDVVIHDRDAWKGAPALDFEDADDVKFDPEQLDRYLRACVDDPERSGELAAALATPGVVDGNGKAKPTDLYFTSGQQKFLDMARKVRDGVTAEDIRRALEGPWAYRSTLPTFGWDVTDDRQYALSAVEPSSKKKPSEPGAEWLALIGLTMFPVLPAKRRVLTPGCGGTWESGHFRWPAWEPALGHNAIRSLIATVSPDGIDPDLMNSLRVTHLFESKIRRFGKGYGKFGPARIAWQRPAVWNPAPEDPFAA